MYKLYRYHSADVGNYLAIIVSEGHKWIHYVKLDYPICIRKVRIGERKFFTEVGYKKDPSTVFLSYGKQLGITKGAEQALSKGA